MRFCVLTTRRPPGSTRTDTRFPDTTLFRSNRAASSKSGAADTLEALGLDMTRASEMAAAQLADLGICFLFAAHHHPAMKRIMPIRKALARRTIFNLMGPLANPARVRRQLIGIARPAYVPVYAEAIHRLGTDHDRKSTRL